MEAEGPPLPHQLPPPTTGLHSQGSLGWGASPSVGVLFRRGVLRTRSVAWTGTCGSWTVAPRRGPPSNGGVPPQACTTQGPAAGAARAAPGLRPPASRTGPWLCGRVRGMWLKSANQAGLYICNGGGDRGGVGGATGKSGSGAPGISRISHTSPGLNTHVTGGQRASLSLPEVELPS